MLDGLNEIEIRELKEGLDKLPPCFLEVKNEIILGCGYWYPLSGKAPSLVASVYSLDKIYEEQKIELLKTVLEEAEIRDVTGYHPYWFKGQQTWTYVKDMTKLLYERDDDGYIFPWLLEMYYYDKSEEWIVYVSHEGTITFAGEKLAQISKRVIPDCYIYNSFEVHEVNKPIIFECFEPGIISEKDACWPSTFAIVKKYSVLYTEHLNWFKEHFSRCIYGLPFDNTPDKTYRGADRDGTSVYGLYNSEFRSERSVLENQAISRLLENDNELSIVTDEADAVLLHGLLQKSDEYELIHARPVGSNEDYPANYSFIGYDICYPIDCSGGFSIICDCLFICRWHGCDEGGTLFTDDFNKLNENGLFDSFDDAYNYMVKYLNEDWSEKGEYCIYEIRTKKRF